MAYVDQKSPSQRAASLASAAILQAGVGAILIYGLATTVLIQPPDGPLIARKFPTAPPSAPPPPQPAASSDPDTRTVVDQTTPPFDPITTGPTFDPAPPVPPSNYGGPVTSPSFDPPLPPPPHFLATAARPLGDRSRWVTTDDYPASELRRDHSGTTGYRVSFAANGKVTGCEVMKSSGWPKLDEAACTNVSRRARFEPGTDTSGAKAAGSYSGSVVWTIPR